MRLRGRSVRKGSLTGTTLFVAMFTTLGMTCSTATTVASRRMSGSAAASGAGENPASRAPASSQGRVAAKPQLKFEGWFHVHINSQHCLWMRSIFRPVLRKYFRARSLTLPEHPRKSNDKVSPMPANFYAQWRFAAAPRPSCKRIATRRPNACCKPSGSTSACAATSSKPWTARPCACCIRVSAAPRADRIFAAR